MEKPPRAGAPWNGAEDEQLMEAFDAFIREQAEVLERTKSSIISRLPRYSADLWCKWREENE
jgi:hypothetical protein